MSKEILRDKPSPVLKEEMEESLRKCLRDAIHLAQLAELTETHSNLAKLRYMLALEDDFERLAEVLRSASENLTSAHSRLAILVERHTERGIASRDEGGAK